jgi:hypothetical protein
MSWKQLLAQRKVQLHTTSKQELDDPYVTSIGPWPPFRLSDDQVVELVDVTAAVENDPEGLRAANRDPV